MLFTTAPFRIVLALTVTHTHTHTHTIMIMVILISCHETGVASIFVVYPPEIPRCQSVVKR